MDKKNGKLRDQFIMAALASLGAGSWNGTVCNFASENKYGVATQLAKAAINVADEILGLTGRDADGNPRKTSVSTQKNEA